MKLKNILLPTDFSEASDRAVPHALEIARGFDARITAFHVRTPFDDDPSRPEYQFFDQRRYEEHLEEQLAEVSKRIQSGDNVDTVLMRNVSAAAGILEYADDKGIDLIVMGSHGRSSLVQFFLGSVAEKVVRHASCPVLTVGPEQDGYRNRPAYRKLLIPYDFSEISKDAVKRGMDFAAAYSDASIELLYILEQSVLPPFEEQWRASALAEIPDVEEAALESLKTIMDPSELEEVQLTVQVGDADGKAEHEIVDYAKQHQVDLIMMATHGLSGLDHVLLGSTTERVVRTAPCPVLTFHTKRE